MNKAKYNFWAALLWPFGWLAFVTLMSSIVALEGSKGGLYLMVTATVVTIPIVIYCMRSEKWWLRFKWVLYGLPSERFTDDKVRIHHMKPWALQKMDEQALATVKSFYMQQAYQSDAMMIATMLWEVDNHFMRAWDAADYEVAHNKRKLSGMHALFQTMGFYSDKDLDYDNLIEATKRHFPDPNKGTLMAKEPDEQTVHQTRSSS